MNRQRKRLAEWLDLTEEVDVSEKPEKPSGKVALTVLTYNGPVFSSLPKPDNITVPSVVSSRSSSTSASPKSPTSTAATSVSEWPKKTESLSVMTPFVEPAVPLPHISTVKAANDHSGVPVPKLGEVFAPPQALASMQVPALDYSKIGVKWGGEVGLGGISAHPETEYKTEVAGQWLQYTNYPQPGLSRLPPDPFRQGIGLPGNFVAAYSSFAPTRDESFSKVPSAVSNAIWWEKRGGRIFRRMFGQDPVLGHMFKEYEPKDKQEQEGKPTAIPVASSPADLDEKAIEELIQNFEDMPIDTRLLMDNDAMLSEISHLITTLQSQQYARLAEMIGPHETPTGPQTEEVKTYIQLRDRLASLIELLPPHLLATIDGQPDSELILSHKIPALDGDGEPVFNGTLPSDDPKLQQPQIQVAANMAMNAAAGLSPINPAPVANMMAPQQQQRVFQGVPHLTVNVGGPPPQGPGYQQYTQPSPMYQQAQTPHFAAPPPPHQQQYAQQPPPQMQQRVYPQPTPQRGGPVMPTASTPIAYAQRPRGSVPPPQGLGAIGVGPGASTYYHQQPPPQQMPMQMSPQQLHQATPTRYSQRARR